MLKLIEALLTETLSDGLFDITDPSLPLLNQVYCSHIFTYSRLHPFQMQLYFYWD